MSMYYYYCYCNAVITTRFCTHLNKVYTTQCYLGPSISYRSGTERWMMYDVTVVYGNCFSLNMSCPHSQRSCFPSHSHSHD